MVYWTISILLVLLLECYITLLKYVTELWIRQEEIQKVLIICNKFDH